jgi:hypothetical protein
VNMTADLQSVPVELLPREIEKIAAGINRSVSLDELDRAWATLFRVQEALGEGQIARRLGSAPAGASGARYSARR